MILNILNFSKFSRTLLLVILSLSGLYSNPTIRCAEIGKSDFMKELDVKDLLSAAKQGDAEAHVDNNVLFPQNGMEKGTTEGGLRS